jgi:hypothetical protein
MPVNGELPQAPLRGPMKNVQVLFGSASTGAQRRSKPRCRRQCAIGSPSPAFNLERYLTKHKIQSKPALFRQSPLVISRFARYVLLKVGMRVAGRAYPCPYSRPFYQPSTSLFVLRTRCFHFQVSWQSWARESESRSLLGGYSSGKARDLQLSRLKEVYGVWSH